MTNITHDLIRSGKLARTFLYLFPGYLGLTLIWYGLDSAQSTADVIGLH